VVSVVIEVSGSLCVRLKAGLECDESVVFAIRIAEAPCPGAENSRFPREKKPQQARSDELVAITLQAAVQVLEKQGAQRT